MIARRQTCFLGGVRLVRGFAESCDLLLSPSRSVIFFPCSKSRDLGPEHGFKACSLKNKGKKLDCHEIVGFLGVTKREIFNILFSGR